MQQKTFNMNAVKYDVYTSTAGVKENSIEAVEEKVNEKGHLQFRLKMIDQNGEVSFLEFDYSEFGQRKIKKFLEKTKMLSEKEMENFNHMKLAGKTFQVEYFATINKHYDKTNPNSRKTVLVIANNSYAPIKEK